MQKILYAICFLLFLFGCSAPQDYTLVWSDEFETEGLLDTLKWSFDSRLKVEEWRSDYIQLNTKNRLENVKISDGKLVITARREKGLSAPFTSSSLSAKQVKEWQEGRLEVRVKAAGGVGSCSAIWLVIVRNMSMNREVERLVS